MKKFPFNQFGVKQWLSQLYRSTVEFQMMEQELILLCLCSWLMSRFELSERQVAYIRSLSEDFRRNLAQEIVFAINNQADITLDIQSSPTDSDAGSRDSVKVTEYESNKIQSDAPAIPLASEASSVFNRQLDGYLTVRVYYSPL